MTDHIFRIGTVVSFNSGDRQYPPANTSPFIIEAQLPPVGTSRQYRIKSMSEGFSRVVVEDQLSLSAAVPNPAQAAFRKPYSPEED